MLMFKSILVLFSLIAIGYCMSTVDDESNKGVKRLNEKSEVDLTHDNKLSKRMTMVPQITRMKLKTILNPSTLRLSRPVHKNVILEDNLNRVLKKTNRVSVQAAPKVKSIAVKNNMGALLESNRVAPRVKSSMMGIINDNSMKQDRLNKLVNNNLRN